MFTFKHENYRGEVIVTIDAVEIAEVAEQFRKFLLAVGYHPSNVNEVLGDAP